MNSYNRITNANIHCGRIANPTERKIRPNRAIFVTVRMVCSAPAGASGWHGGLPLHRENTKYK